MEPIEIIIKIKIESDGKVSVIPNTSVPVQKIEGIALTEITSPPTIPLNCDHYLKKIGKKHENTCRGCTITCPAKGKYEKVLSNA